MITLVKDFSVIYKERPHEVLFIQEDKDGKVSYCCIERIDSKVVGEKAWILDEAVSLVKVEERVRFKERQKAPHFILLKVSFVADTDSPVEDTSFCSSANEMRHFFSLPGIHP